MLFWAPKRISSARASIRKGIELHREEHGQRKGKQDYLLLVLGSRQISCAAHGTAPQSIPSVKSRNGYSIFCPLPFWDRMCRCSGRESCLHFQLYLLLQRILCWVLLPGWWLPMLPEDESQIFLCTRERGMCWRLHFPRKRCTVQLLFYKIKQF